MSGTRLTENDIEAIRGAAASGTAIRQIAVAIGRDQKTVRAVVRKLLESGQLEPKEPRVSCELREAIRVHAHRTISHAALAAELGCREWTVRTIRSELTAVARAKRRKADQAAFRQREIADSGAPVDRLGAALAAHPRPLSVTGPTIGRPVTFGRLAPEQSRGAA